MNIRGLKILFGPLLILRIYFGLSRRRLFVSWFRLELNVIRVVPLLCLRRDQFSSEVRLKYFLVQGWASRIFLFRISLQMLGVATIALLGVALGLKLGAAPLHFWFIRCLRTRTYENLFILSTVQKVLPLYFLILIERWGLIRLYRGLSAFIASWGVFNRRNLSVILGYSSVFTLGWLLAARLQRDIMWVRYLITYRIGLLGLLLLLKEVNLVSVSQLKFIKTSFMGQIVLFLLLIAIGGLPPFFSFWLKLIIFESVIKRFHIFLGLILLLRSFWFMYLYIRIRFYRLIEARREKCNSVVQNCFRRLAIIRVFVLGLIGVLTIFRLL